MTNPYVTKLRRVILLRRWANILEDWKQSILNADTNCDFRAWEKSLDDWRKSCAEFRKEISYDA